MRHLYKKLSVALAALLLLSACEGVSGGAAGSSASEGEKRVAVYTTVRTTGQYPEQFVVLPNGSPKSDKVSAEVFHMKGNAGGWGSGSTHDFTAEFESAKVEDGTLTLVPKDFPEKYFYVTDFEVTCDSDPAYSFTSDDVGKTITPVADDFETVLREDGSEFDYHIFTPEKTEGMPLVVVFHGFGDTSNLLTYRTAVEWAEPENQAKRPCYVIAPVIGDEEYYETSGRDRVFEALKALIDKMVSEGKVDGERIYMMGNSFGGMSTIEFAEKYPGYVKKALALCPALTYSPRAVSSLDKIKDLSIWFAHAKNDQTIPVSASEDAVKKLKDLGSDKVKLTVYTDEEMNAKGADPAPDATYSYHHVELAVMEDDAYMEWMFE